MNTLLFEFWFSCVTLLDCDTTLLGDAQNGCCVLCYTRTQIPLLINCAQPECTVCRVNRALLTRTMLLTGSNYAIFDWRQPAACLPQREGRSLEALRNHAGEARRNTDRQALQGDPERLVQ